MNVEREVAEAKADPGRVRRFLVAMATRLEQFGISIGANLVTSYLQSKSVSLL